MLRNPGLAGMVLESAQGVKQTKGLIHDFPLTETDPQDRLAAFYQLFSKTPQERKDRESPILWHQKREE